MAQKIGEILIQRGVISSRQLEAALERSQTTGEFLGESLIRLGAVQEEVLYEALAEQSGIPYMPLKNRAISPEVIKKVPSRLAWHYKVFPVETKKNNQLVVAISNPLSLWPLDELALHLRMEIEPVLASQSEIQDAIRKHYGVGADTIDKLVDRRSGEETTSSIILEEKTEDIEKMAEDASVIKLVNQILREAIEQKATDIHIEPYQNELSVRYRVDGVLQAAKLSTDIKYLYDAIISRIKIMSGLNIVEKRLPQDGRARVRIGENEWDLRISILPTLHGENLVIRILPTSMLFSLEKLGLTPQDLRILEQLIMKPHGVIFVTGPTGSGKTTTLYACLSRLNSPQRKIITIEDPVEYELRGIAQIQVNRKIELTFARALRNMLRHDPNIMMVGEVRDFETAEIAIQVALTGHLVFSTLHTNDSTGGITRLVDMGVEPFLITSAVEAFLAQRLVRMICPACRKSIKRPEAIKEISERLEALGRKLPPGDFEADLYQGKGCEYCKSTGYAGRTAIYEILPITETIKTMILKRSSAHEIKKEAIKRGMRPLIEDGWEKVKQGHTTVEEVLRVTQLED